VVDVVGVPIAEPCLRRRNVETHGAVLSVENKASWALTDVRPRQLLTNIAAATIGCVAFSDVCIMLKKE
jgi:hypothetical protein